MHGKQPVVVVAFAAALAFSVPVRAQVGSGLAYLNQVS
jgi:hypothetical protein